MHIIVFASITLSRGAVLSYLLPIFLYRYYLNVSLFLENSSIAWIKKTQLLHTNVFTDVLGITQRVISLRKPFYSIYYTAESRFEVFWGWFWLFLSIIESCSLSYLMKFCADVSFVILTVINLRASFPLLGGIIQYFWACFRYTPQCLEKLKTFSLYFAWAFWYCRGGH